MAETNETQPDAPVPPAARINPAASDPLPSLEDVTGEVHKPSDIVRDEAHGDALLVGTSSQDSTPKVDGAPSTETVELSGVELGQSLRRMHVAEGVTLVNLPDGSALKPDESGHIDVPVQQVVNALNAGHTLASDVTPGAKRAAGSYVGQVSFDPEANRPVWWGTQGAWVDANGQPV